MMRAITSMALLWLLLIPSVDAHDGHGHPPKPQTDAGVVPMEAPVTPFPVRINARFDLIDQDGARRTEADYRGAYPLIFFGYANCEGICSVAVPRMAQALDLLEQRIAARLRPIVITVDPEADTPAAMKAKLAELHPALIGLTGDESALEAARIGFGVKRKLLFTDPKGNPTYAHGGFLFLLGPGGELLTVLPPILDPDRMAALIAKYVGAIKG